ncbi:hypothetical protein [Streptomyces sp. NPDC049813]|uniref:hypothetical protein n=1 Tax=Streptomyces sp. NPDC049813 TaxID=3365597 RepID=UPI00379E94EE
MPRRSLGAAGLASARHHDGATGTQADEAVVVIARSTQEAVVVNLPKLHALPVRES